MSVDNEGWISRSPEQNRALKRESRNSEQNQALEEEKTNLLEKKEYLENQITTIEGDYEAWGSDAQKHLDYLEEELDKTEDEILDLDNPHASKQWKLYEKRKNLISKFNFFVTIRSELMFNEEPVPPYLNRDLSVSIFFVVINLY